MIVKIQRNWKVTISRSIIQPISITHNRRNYIKNVELGNKTCVLIKLIRKTTRTIRGNSN